MLDEHDVKTMAEKMGVEYEHPAWGLPIPAIVFVLSLACILRGPPEAAMGWIICAVSCLLLAQSRYRLVQAMNLGATMHAALMKSQEFNEIFAEKLKSLGYDPGGVILRGKKD